jgi:chemotaxis protein methyltransferase CheR
MQRPVPDAKWSELSNFVASRMGLHFPRERWEDLKRGLAGAAHELGFDDIAACIGCFLSGPPTKSQLHVLATHLTIGETYFFRDKAILDALAENILPELIRERRGRERRLRIWSAGCCTGEEAYSLAILLHQLVDLSHWHVTITATDINGRYLQKASAGVYGEWSFRDTPVRIKERYFKRSPDGRYAILPEIKRLVSFEHLNLVEDVYPTLATDTNAMDLIVCRNVLMYFTPFQIRKVISKLHHALVDGGWLAVSPSEASQALFPEFHAVNFPGATVYQKRDGKVATEQRSTPGALGHIAPIVAPPIETSSRWAAPVQDAQLTKPSPVASPEKSVFVQTPPASFAMAESLYHEGRYAQAAEVLVTALAEGALEAPAFSLLARALANQGRLADALGWCDRWIAVDKVDAAAHYLRATVLLEQGDAIEARSSLQRAVYLDADFVVAHFALGNLARGRGKSVEADKHFRNALRLLARHGPSDLLPESDGLTAGRLTDTITALIALENTP